MPLTTSLTPQRHKHPAELGLPAVENNIAHLTTDDWWVIAAGVTVVYMARQRLRDH